MFGLRGSLYTARINEPKRAGRKDIILATDYISGARAQPRLARLNEPEKAPPAHGVYFNRKAPRRCLAQRAKTRRKMCHRHIFLDSSMVEHSAVNRGVVGSSPTRGAYIWRHGQAVRHGSATPLSPVRFWLSPSK